MNIAFVTTFANVHYDLYAKKMLQSFTQFMPAEVPLCVQIDDDTLYPSVDKLLRPQDGIAVGWDKDHSEFVARNKGKDDSQDYRKQPVRFCHKVFALKRAYDAAMKQKAVDATTAPRYLVWIDADVIINRLVMIEDIAKCLPKDGDAVAYLGRKDWPHSECGWVAYDLDKGGDKIIDLMIESYTNDHLFLLEQQDDSWVFDHISCHRSRTNLSPDAIGLDAWESSPMSIWSTHYKGPIAKQQLALQRPAPQNNKVIINTKNAIPHKEICQHIEENQKLITNWIKPCSPHDEEIVIVSAGPMLVAEDVRAMKGKKIVAVKHALEPLKKAGVKVWASILLDPRPHVSNFVDNPDPSIIWFVASQVDPEVTRKLIAAGCKIWGYHAAVGADEQYLTNKQHYSVISGGSATATRGMFVMSHLGFKSFQLFGYDLCIPDKPDMNAKDEFGQPKYMEMSVGFSDGNLSHKKCFWTEPQLIAQFEEINEIIKQDKFKIEAHGDGIVPFVIKSKKLAELRNKELIARMTDGKTIHYEDLLWGLSTNWRKWLPKTLRKRMQANSY